MTAEGKTQSEPSRTDQRGGEKGVRGKGHACRRETQRDAETETETQWVGSVRVDSTDFM